MVAILTPVYEAEFLGFSYGFRPGRGQHDALDALAAGIARKRINWVLDADIRSFFDTISHDWLVRFVEHRIGDRRIIRLIRKWLQAGVLEEGRGIETVEGTPQGAVDHSTHNLAKFVCRPGQEVRGRRGTERPGRRH